MITTLLVIGATLLFASIIILIRFYIFKQQLYIGKICLGARRAPKIYKIAILIPDASPCIIRLYQAFIKKLSTQNSKNFWHTIFNTNGNKERIAHYLEQIMQDDFNLIFSCGLECTLAAKEYTKKHKNKIPIVFCEIPGDLDELLLDSTPGSENNLTGTFIPPKDYQQQIGLLSFFKPEKQNVLLVYHSKNIAAANEVKKLSTALKKTHNHVQTIELFHLDNLEEKLEPHLVHAKTLILPRDHIMNSHLKKLSPLCSKHGVLLYTSDLASVSEGAAIGYGPCEESIAQLCTQKASSILLKNIHPSTIPSNKDPLPHKMYINVDILKKQNPVFEESILTLIQRGQIIQKINPKSM
jgi:ABC-type uncharacterized transport system substrate-binding protein